MNRDTTEGPTANSFADRLAEMIDVLRQAAGVTLNIAEIGPPCTEDEIAQVQQALGHRLSDSFLGYYRSANGARVRWHSEFATGGMDLPPLVKIFDAESVGHTFGWDDVEPEERELPLLGGIDEFALRKALRVIDEYPKDGNGYPTVALFTDDERTDPVVLFPNDACAALADSFPMLATTYFEMLLATCGHSQAIDHDFTYRGYEAAHPLITWSRDDWSSLGGPGRYLRWLRERGDVRERYAPMMSNLVGLLDAGERPAAIVPRRWIELRYDLAYPS